MTEPTGICQCGCGLPTLVSGVTRWSAGLEKGKPKPFRPGHRALLNSPAPKECECGCGQQTRVALYSDRPRGYVRGQRLRFVDGHQLSYVRSHIPEPSGRAVEKDGYVRVVVRESPRDEKGRRRYIGEHVRVAERARGKPLPKGAVVHHVNGDKHDNRPENLVVCQNAAYHQLLHVRAEALAACGHAGWRRCHECRQWAAPELVMPGFVGHRACWKAHYNRENEQARARKAARKVNLLRDERDWRASR